MFPHSYAVDAEWKRDAVCNIKPRGEPFATGGFDHCFPVNILGFTTAIQLSEVASGVAYLHELKVVHGDLKGVRSPAIHSLSFVSLTD